MKFHFFSLITERVYCRNDIDQYGLAGLVSGVADSLDGGLVVRKYEDLGFEPWLAISTDVRPLILRLGISTVSTDVRPLILFRN